MKGSDFVVVYDITQNRERAKVVKVLKGYGIRAQKSVFECRLSKAGIKNLVNRLKALDIQTGFIKIYRLEYSFNQPVLGKQKDGGFDDGTAFIV